MASNIYKGRRASAVIKSAEIVEVAPGIYGVQVTLDQNKYHARMIKLPDQYGAPAFDGLELRDESSEYVSRFIYAFRLTPMNMRRLATVEKALKARKLGKVYGFNNC